MKMKMAKIVFGLLLLSGLSVGLAANAQAQSASMIANFKVGAVSVTSTGNVSATTDGGFQSLTGPLLSCGAVNFHTNAAGVANSDAVKDRMLNVLLAAQLSGRKVMGTIVRTAAGVCFLEQVNVVNIF